MKKILVFACKRGRPRDVPLLREGARAGGYRFVLVLVPFAYPVLLLAALARWFGADIATVISDRFPGDRWLARLLEPDCARMLWNYADEFPGCLSTAPAVRVCFFDDTQRPVQRFRFAPQPLVRPLNHAPAREVVFMGDVNLGAPDLPSGADWWIARFEQMRAEQGYGFYLSREFEALLASRLHTAAHLRQARVLSKNLLRLWIVQAAREAVGPRLRLVGSNWRRFGLDCEPSAYSLATRLRLYESAAVNLDCGSKSGDSALYPRSSEVMSYAGAPLQVVCADSSLVYGERVAEFVFDSADTLRHQLEQRLTEPDAQRMERAAWLASHLAAQRLTMADSFRSLFGGGLATVGPRDAKPQEERPA